MHMFHAILSIITLARSEEAIRELAVQARMLIEGARRDVKQPEDLDRLEEKYDRVAALVG